MAKVASKVLIVDDEPYICRVLSRLLEKQGISPIVAFDGEAGLALIRKEIPDLLILDLKMPRLDGMQVLKAAKTIDKDLPVIMITAYAEVHGAVEAMKAGAHDYLAKPFNHDEVILAVCRLLAERDLKRKVQSLSSQLGKASLREFMGTSEAVYKVVQQVNLVARSNLSVVVVGETGVGKELVARSIHQASARSKSPFVPVDCGAIPETLIESELFGHEKGAYTGAFAQQCGKFEAAHGGTLFLDEIGNLPLGSQAKLLRALQEKAVNRVGGIRAVPVDARVVAASNEDLPRLTASGSFRSDLMFRLNEFTIVIPPLRKRKEDIVYQAKRFLDITNAELSKCVKGFSKSALEALLLYDWPGNVRQLKSCIRRAVLLADEVISEGDLGLNRAETPVSLPKISGMSWLNVSLKEIVRSNTIALEREVLAWVLRQTGGNKAKAARLLQIDYKTIHVKLKEYGIGLAEGESYDKKR